MDLWSAGAMPTVVATALRYRISCEMCSRYKLLVVHLQQSYVRDLSSPGVAPTLVAAASRFRLLCVPLLQSSAMDLWSPGEGPTMVATAVRYSISCKMYNRSKLLRVPLLQSSAMDLWSPGCCQLWWLLPCSTGSVARCAADPRC